MKKLLMLFTLAAAMLAVQASGGRGTCHKLIHDVTHRENMTEIMGSCMEENGIVPDLEGPGPGRRSGGRKERLLRFVSRLPQANQTAIVTCVLEKEGSLTDDGLFDATKFTEELSTKLEAEQTTQADAMLAAIENGVCVVKEMKPSLTIVFDFVKCLIDECKEATDLSFKEA
ncbi:uncharacterized protein LOC125037039 [Penaeus chinensis]|uniref:uncharacterized protein LOC125037039 n=1 Tax=Penaeus chinensis TaxID=139456 RepID=UPI001FB622D1|nr:uncharacterized protein LOC125037039 [Penaeus chinensis]